MKIIVGLGNPGKKYEQTRHNIGFEVIDAMTKEWGKDNRFFCSGSERHKLYDATEWEYRNSIGVRERIVLVKPQTFMNLSGEAVRFVAQHTPKTFHIEEDLWVIHDDIDVDFGRVKIDRNRSAGGHNGIKNIIDILGTKDFIRFRVGIRTEKRDFDTQEYVLKRFLKSESEMIPGILSLARESCECTLEQGFDFAQNLTNGRNRKISA